MPDFYLDLKLEWQITNPSLGNEGSCLWDRKWGVGPNTAAHYTEL